MSRIGKSPISLPDGVVVDVNGLNVKVSGPKGQLSSNFVGNLAIDLHEEKIFVRPLVDDKRTKAMWGTVRSVLNNMVIGVTKGFNEELEINGVGYRAAVQGNYLNLNIGKSHNTKIMIPSDIKLTLPKQDMVVLESIDKQRLGQFMAHIIKQRPTEPYKGKGIKKKGQYVFRKEGKKVK